MTSPSYVNRLIRFFTAVFRSGFCLKLQSLTTMASSKQCLLEELTASDQSNCSDVDDSSGTDDLTIVKVTGLECSDNAICSCARCAYCFECYIHVGGHNEYHQQKGRPGQQRGV
jgi:hypothetical protein